MFPSLLRSFAALELTFLLRNPPVIMHFVHRLLRASAISLFTTAAISFSAEPKSIGLNANQMSIATGQPSLVLMSSGSTHILVWSLSGGTVGQSLAGVVRGLPSDCAQ